MTSPKNKVGKKFFFYSSFISVGFPSLTFLQQWLTCPGITLDMEWTGLGVWLFGTKKNTTNWQQMVFVGRGNSVISVICFLFFSDLSPIGQPT